MQLLVWDLHSHFTFRSRFKFDSPFANSTTLQLKFTFIQMRIINLLSIHLTYRVIQSLFRFSSQRRLTLLDQTVGQISPADKHSDTDLNLIPASFFG